MCSSDLIYYCSGVALRDLYDQGVSRIRFKFALQRVAARLEKTIRGKEPLIRREARNRAETDCHYRYHDACERCSARNICDGFHGDYAEMFGTSEAVPVTDIPLTDDPLFYIREQEKTVEEEDKAWAL